MQPGLCCSPCLRVNAFANARPAKLCVGAACGQALRVRVTPRRSSMTVRAVDTKDKETSTKDKEKADRLVRGVLALLKDG